MPSHRRGFAAGRAQLAAAGSSPDSCRRITGGGAAGSTANLQQPSPVGAGRMQRAGCPGRRRSGAPGFCCGIAGKIQSPSPGRAIAADLPRGVVD